MAITFSGLATGLDTDAIVTDIMELERAPLDRIEAQKASETQRLEAYAQFKTKLDDLKSAISDMTLTSQIRTTSISLSSSDTISATSSGATTGSYNVSVAQLSQVQKSVSNGFSSNTESVLGTGTITINGSEITITDDNNSLYDLVQEVNDLSDTTGVKASILNDGSGGNEAYHLIFTGVDSDTSFTVTSDLENASEEAIDLGITVIQEAQQAVAFIDGIEVVSSSNTISGAINGVTIDLNAVSSTSYSGTSEDGVDPWDWADPPIYETTKLEVESDTEALKEKITTFVTSYNDVMDWILSGYEEFGGSSVVDEESGEDASLGPLLRGDATINSVKRQLQSVLTDTIDNSGQYSILSEIGITTNINGTLNQNNDTLDDALDSNFEDMVALLSGDDSTGGVMKNFNSLLLDLTSSTQGMYANQKQAYDSAVDRFDLQIDQMELRLEKREATLRNQFNVMEQLVSSLNAQGDFFTQQMDALNGDN